MKPIELELKIERTQCGGFTIRKVGEAPHFVTDPEDLIPKIEDLLAATFDDAEPTDFDEPDDEDFDDDDGFVHQSTGIVQVDDITDFNITCRYRE